MRKTVEKQIKKYLFSSWVIGTSVLVFSFISVHGSVTHSDWIIILATSCATGGAMWTMIDYWKYEEGCHSKKRIMKGVSSRRN